MHALKDVRPLPCRHHRPSHFRGERSLCLRTSWPPARLDANRGNKRI